MVLDTRLKSAAQKVLPRFILGWLDPFQRAIDTEVALAAAHLSDGEVVLDAGAGEARHRACFAHGRYLAVDAGSGDPRWDYSRLDILADLERLPLRSRSVRSILCMVVLEHTRNPRIVCAEFARVLDSGGSLHMVVPFLWEEHQAPNDFFRFTQYGVRLLFDGLPLRLTCLQPIGGFFWVIARRCVNLLTFFQRGWRWLLFVPLAPIFGFLLPVLLYFLDGLDHSKTFTLGYLVRAAKDGE